VTADLANGLFEALGAVFLGLNVRQIWRDREIKGVHWAPTVFFTTWSTFNLWFYPSQGLWASFWGGSVIAAMNCAWLASLFHFRGSKTP
jgi:hypothetical protein